MAGGIDQVKLIPFVFKRVINGNRMHTDSNSPLALQIHTIEQLGTEIALSDRPGFQQELIGQRALAVVDMGDDGKIPDQPGVGHAMPSVPWASIYSRSFYQFLPIALQSALLRFLFD